jgi:L-lactate dehydrogenase complex protein LldE
MLNNQQSHSLETVSMPLSPPNPDKVYFFGTCIINTIFPQAGLSAIRLLEREGIAVVFPQEQSCCGQPAFNSGFPGEARQVARRQLYTFKLDYPIVVPSGSCAGMMKHHYPELFAGDRDEEQALRFSSRVFELSRFLADVVKIRLTDHENPLKVTWHSSCHAMREMDVTKDAKTLLAQLSNVHLTELEREYECCGFGGTFAVKHPLISAAMVRDKIDDIVQTGARRVISGDCGCLLHIRGALDKCGLDVETQHLAEFLWERTYG